MPERWDLALHQVWLLTVDIRYAMDCHIAYLFLCGMMIPGIHLDLFQFVVCVFLGQSFGTGKKSEAWTSLKEARFLHVGAWWSMYYIFTYGMSSQFACIVHRDFLFFLLMPAYSWFLPLIFAANKVLGEWNTSTFGIWSWLDYTTEDVPRR